MTSDASLLRALTAADAELAAELLTVEREGALAVLTVRRPEALADRGARERLLAVAAVHGIRNLAIELVADDGAAPRLPRA